MTINQIKMRWITQNQTKTKFLERRSKTSNNKKENKEPRQWSTYRLDYLAAETGPGREKAENARKPKTDKCAGLEWCSSTSRPFLFDIKRTTTLVRFLKSLGKKVHIQFLSSTFLSVLILAFLAQPRRINLELFNISRPSTFWTLHWRLSISCYTFNG